MIRTLVKLGFSPKIIKYLLNKWRGGEVNQRGNNYETHFSAYKIISIINSNFALISNISISAQENSFVDDVYINYDFVIKSKEFYQLKTSQKLNWGKGFKSLSSDFNFQKMWAERMKIDFSLFLVVADNDLKTEMVKELPTNLKTCTQIVHFPYYDSISLRIKFDNNFRNELVGLCALNTPTSDKLESLAAVILGAWQIENRKDISISSIYNRVSNVDLSFIKSHIPLDISDELRTILNAIPDFSYYIENGYLRWIYKHTDKGVVPYRLDSKAFSLLNNLVIIKNPTTFQSIETLLV